LQMFVAVTVFTENKLIFTEQLVFFL